MRMKFNMKINIVHIRVFFIVSITHLDQEIIQTHAEEF